MPSSPKTPASPIFRFKNLGPIEEAELELGDLTIIAGRNNTGKTYLTYTLYGFLNIDKSWQYSLGNEFDTSEIIALFEKASKEGVAKHCLTKEELKARRQKTINALTKKFSTDALSEVFSSSSQDFKGAIIEINLREELPSFPKCEIKTGVNIYTMEYQDEQLIVSTNIHKIEEYQMYQVLKSAALVLYHKFIFPELNFDPFILSAERFSIPLFYRELDFTKDRIIYLMQRAERTNQEFLPFFDIDENINRYTLPIRDNINYVRYLDYHQRHKSEIYEDKLHNNVSDMVGGTYKISSATGGIRFISKSRKHNKFDIPIHIASSSAREFSDLYFFLRYTAKKNQLLIIDEPESHLDTANQREMARLLGRIIQSGIKVLITTHSDYIIKEINNLIMLSYLDDPKVSKRLKYSPNEYIGLNSVRAYIAEDKGLTRCKIDKYGMDMPVFDDTINDINRVSNDLTDCVIFQEDE